ncbi:glutaminase A [Mycolicibacterium fortuitum]|uniref:Glutaminase n=2 Tax=Mycolicibacterium fortuitum TaxID=1766 RepID=A0AAE4VHI9_MYCFO|nr:glutaminase A [Mycolicibacterium fortuitum]MCV7144265.1 glutaminase A [Mycolicibacterium fortuitum]MDV7194351.1 glutaminase A [Mycolicibacterium fortuitum]MDV7208034.1 glutaminase A [Mycolicibacterium fortuitum]MDV7229871.1 glutaminase A [Mycolicibacterium fortuitum]MDV7261626.1 glutaminase A [Mycolicibacterium fortuitum]
MAELVQHYLDRIRAEQIELHDGALASYIPELSTVDPESFGLSLSTSDGYVYESGDTAVEFTIQSISKPFTYALALELIGQDAVDAKIGVEPSGEAFNEISVDNVTKTPKNAMINAGAIAAVSLVPGAGADERFDRILEFYSACAGRRLHVDMDVYGSEKATGNRNRAIAYMLASFGVLDGDPDEVLDVYFRQCSVRVTSTDLARMATTLARGGCNPMTGRRVSGAKVVRRTLSVMVTCGMYDATGDWVSAVGMPAKSGVGGGIVAVLPGQLGIGVYSPRLDARGNSVRGVEVCRNLSSQLGLHFLSVTRESSSTLRAVFEVSPGVRVYEVHGDLLFAGAEQVLRTAERDRDSYDVAVLDVTRVDDINDAARAMLTGMRANLAAAGKEAYLVDPDGRVVPADRRDEYDAIVFCTLEEAVEAARQWGVC